MNEPLRLLMAAAAGIALGAIFFGGLWWTILKSVESRHPGLWFFTSLLLRMSIAVAGFYFVSSAHWQRLAMCLLGFLAARFLVIWLTRSSRAHPVSPANEARHAP